MTSKACHPERSEAGRPPAGGDLNLPLPVILNPRFLRMKDLVLNQILPPVGRQNDIKSLSS